MGTANQAKDLISSLEADPLDERHPDQVGCLAAEVKQLSDGLTKAISTVPIEQN